MARILIIAVEMIGLFAVVCGWAFLHGMYVGWRDYHRHERGDCCCTGLCAHARLVRHRQERGPDIDESVGG